MIMDVSMNEEDVPTVDMTPGADPFTAVRRLKNSSLSNHQALVKVLDAIERTLGDVRVTPTMYFVAFVIMNTIFAFFGRE